VTHYRDCIRSRYDQACKDINANPIAAAAVKGEQGSSMCSSCGHEIALHGTNGCTVELDSAWTASNTKPCGCRNKPND